MVWAALLALFLVAGCAGKSPSAIKQDLAVADALTGEATRVVEENLAKDKDGVLKRLIAKAKGMLIIPAIGDASFFVSVGGGNAVLLANIDKGWTGPVFMTKGSVGYGIQAGVSRESGILLFMHEDDVRYMLRTGAVLQGQARAVILNVDWEINNTDQFYQSGDVFFVGERAGLYAGLAVNTGGYSDRTGLNEAFTDVKGGGPRSILLEKKVQPEGAKRLREVLDEAVAGAGNGPAKEKDGIEIPSL